MTDVILRIGNLQTRVDTTDVALVQRLDKVFSVRQPGAYWNPQVRAGRWDGVHHFFRRAHQNLPTGFLDKLLNKLQTEHARIRIDDTRRPAAPDIKKVLSRLNCRSLRGITLRDYQLECARQCLSHTLDGLPFPRGVVQLPTGSGKTEVIAAVCKAAVGLRGLVLVHQKDLLYQTAQRLALRMDEKVGIIGDGLREPRRITVSTVQTLHRHLKEFTTDFLKNQQMFLGDESHHIGSAKTFRQVADCCPAYIRLAFSATPFVRDDPVQQMRLIGCTGSLVYFMSPQEAVADDIVSQVRVLLIPIDQPKEVEIDNDSDAYGTVPSAKLTYGGKNGAYQKLIVENPVRNKHILDYVKRASGPTLVIVSRLDHGRALANAIGCPFLWGDHAAGDRQQVLTALGLGRLRAVVASPIFDEGVDAPAIRNLVLACGGKSDLKVMQRIGRGMRRKADGGELEVLDFIDGTNRYLLKHSEQRIKTAQTAGFILDV